MAINHDLTFYPDWLVVKQENPAAFVFLDLPGRFETFDEDAEWLEREQGLQISKIRPRDALGDVLVPACRFGIQELVLMSNSPKFVGRPVTILAFEYHEAKAREGKE